MRGHCYAVASGKGGVGKTTTVVNVAYALARRELDVVLVDADLAMTNLGRMLGVDHEPTLHDVLTGDASLSAAIDQEGSVAVLPGSDDIDVLRDADPANLGQVIKRLKTAFDVVLVDTGAGIGHETMVSCGTADDVALVTTPDETAVSDTGKSKSLVGKVDGNVLGVVVTRTEEESAADVATELGADLLGAIPDDPTTVGDEPVVENAPDSEVATAYGELAGALAVGIDASGDGQTASPEP